jgi:UDP-N-acetylmuramoyl-tripeptide--D-alanyl-D-alanine ligase
MQFSLPQVREAISAKLTGWSAHAQSERIVRGWSIDSRTVTAGDLFFAIKGDKFDGHAFVQACLDHGAVAAVVSEAMQNIQGPLLRVQDTLAALQSVARWARKQWHCPVVAVTGSAGKTSTKEIIASILSKRFRVGKTTGNLNNHLGLPLTVLRLPDDADLAVVEMGMNHAGEIAKLCEIAEPEIGVVTNVGFAHIEFFDSIEGIAAAKRELIEALPRSGVAILNADDERVARFAAVHEGRSILYGWSDSAEVRAENSQLHPDGSCFTVDGVRFQTRLTGRHSISNILAGLAVAKAFEIPLSELTGVVSALEPGSMRGERHVWNGATILNDSYNSNPEAARSMIDVLAGSPAQRRIAVLGEMLELGRKAEELHRELGAYAVQSGVDVLIGVRGASKSLVEAGRQNGLADGAALFFDEPEEAGEFLRTLVRNGDAVLFKGSRGSHVERALAAMER